MWGLSFPKGNFVSIGIAVLLTSKGVKLRSRFERFVGSVDYIRGVRVEKAYVYPLPTFSNNDLPLHIGWKCSLQGFFARDKRRDKETAGKKLRP